MPAVPRWLKALVSAFGSSCKRLLAILPKIRRGDQRKPKPKRVKRWWYARWGDGEIGGGSDKYFG